MRYPETTLPPMRHTRWQTHDLAIGRDAVDLRAALGREWLITNGTGAFAMGTVAGCNTRRYHGLLVAASHPPVGRVLALNQLLEKITFGRRRAELEFATCLFRDGGDIFAPHGVQSLRRFRRGLSVAWTYQHDDLVFQRELILHWKQQAATIRYRITGLDAMPKKATLHVEPMLTLRDFHAVLRRDSASPFDVTAGRGAVTVQRDDVAVTIACPGATFKKSDTWWNDVHFPVDAERGQEHIEDQFVPGSFSIALPRQPEVEVALSVALGNEAVDPAEDCDDRAQHLQPIVEQLADAVPPPGDKFHDKSFSANLAIAADDFVVDRTIHGDGLETIIAGYPWFADWGRDTFIALPGLLLCTGRHDEAQKVLRVFAEAIADGLVPNRFDDYDDNAAHYNTVDASLWFIHAAMQYRDAAGDVQAWVDWLAEACTIIVDTYIRGAAYGIAMAGDGLIAAGTPGTQLTWMDAAADGKVFTPRHGKAIEINALWYNALMGLVDRLPTSMRDKADHYKRLGGRIKRAFPHVFWRDDLDALYDHVVIDEAGEKHPDPAVRPNQVFIASLPYSPIPRTRQTKVVKLVREKLLTPYGLLTLPADDPNYHGQYTGDQFHRDEAYHQGTIWPWLIGPYAEAVLRTGKFSDEAKAEALQAITPLLNAMTTSEASESSIGQLHEIYEADPQPDATHRPVGCIAQAWSIAELIRVLCLIESA